MYDDLLGKRKKKAPCGDYPENCTDHKCNVCFTKPKTYWKKINFQLDTPTKNGRIYPTHVVRDELNRLIPKKNYRKNFFLVYDTPQDPTTVNLAHVIGIVLDFKIRGVDVLLEIQYLKGHDAYHQFDIALCCLGDTDDKNIVKSPLTITQVYMI